MTREQGFGQEIATGKRMKLLRRRILTAALAIAGCTLLAFTPQAYAAFGFEPGSVNFSFTSEADVPVTQAGAHPYQVRASFAFNQTTNERGLTTTDGDLKDIHTVLPVGLVGNPTAVPACGNAEFFTQSTSEGITAFDSTTCRPEAQIGTATVRLSGEIPVLEVPVYNLVPRFGVPAEFGFNPAGLGIKLVPEVRTGRDYGITVSSIHTSQVRTIFAVDVRLWGVPAAPAHNAERGQVCAEVFPGFPFCEGGGHPAGTPRPFLTLPTACAGPLSTTFEANSWQDPADLARETVVSRNGAGEVAGMEGCARLDFTPTIGIVPEASVASSPTGLSVDLHVPQNEGPEGLAAADLKDAVVSLPAGVAVDPASANGLAACTPAQIELHGPEPARCPDAAKIGEVEVDTPLLDHPLPGAVYVAAPRDNPFGSLLAIYVAIDDPQSGIVVKLAGHVEADPQTGQLTTTFDENPQLPFEDFKLDFFGGPRAALRTPSACGTFTTTTDLTPWTSPEGADAHPSSAFEIASGAGGRSCVKTEAEQPNSPSFAAGTQSPLAGSFSPFVLRLEREDGMQRIRAINTVLPKGLVGKLAGIPYCPEADIATARSREGVEGAGSLEQASPSCPAASQVGGVTVGAGAGPSPIFVQGKAYLAGPYEGASLSLVIITPAVAGPYDLGTVVVRAALHLNPETAQITAQSDSIPTILQGIPLDVRSIALTMDRPEFTLNPTNCEAMSVSGQAISTTGDVAPLRSRFQVGGCGGLGFKPRLQLSLGGSTKHAGHPALKAVLTYPKQGTYANIERAQVNLPHSEFLDQGNLNKTCTRPVLLAGNCPKTSIYGRAKAWTPLLEKPLEGPVYLVGGYGYKLPALVAELNGQIRVLLVGRVDSGPNKGIRNTFEAVPDAPVEKFVLEMKGGKQYSLLENSENLCAKPQRAIAYFTAQNGKVESFKPKVANSCKKHDKSKRHGGS